MGPVFLQLSEVLAIHQDQIVRYGGAPGMRELHLVESAIAVPQAGVGEDYLHEGLFEMAAAYLYYIVQDHPFIDGNKRTGLASALVFLKMNGVSVEPDDRLEALVREVARGKANKTRVVDLLRELAGQ
ncbi:MAG: type II toxin-antitoxin system death-on-curing family toxin [Candidatus Brocadiia bacterium]